MRCSLEAAAFTAPASKCRAQTRRNRRQVNELLGLLRESLRMRKAKTLSIQAYTAARQQVEIASSAVVLACAAALLLAGQPLPH